MDRLSLVALLDNAVVLSIGSLRPVGSALRIRAVEVKTVCGRFILIVFFLEAVKVVSPPCLLVVDKSMEEVGPAVVNDQRLGIERLLWFLRLVFLIIDLWAYLNY